jgi:hypothetical protein
LAIKIFQLFLKKIFDNLKKYFCHYPKNICCLIQSGLISTIDWAFEENFATQNVFGNALKKSITQVSS